LLISSNSSRRCQETELHCLDPLLYELQQVRELAASICALKK
jgi:hypothetical protein